jgi:hypothetical protein
MLMQDCIYKIHLKSSLPAAPPFVPLTLMTLPTLEDVIVIIVVIIVLAQVAIRLDNASALLGFDPLQVCRLTIPPHSIPFSGRQFQLERVQ